MRWDFFLFLTLTFLLLYPSRVLSAAGVGSVVISEIAWMGTLESSSDEWVELFNTTDEEISLVGWGLYEQGGEALIEPLTGSISARSFFLLERTDDSTVPEKEASQEPGPWSGGGLSNSGEHLVIKDDNGTVIDEVNSSAGWFAGDNSTKRTMERIHPLGDGNAPGNWSTNASPLGNATPLEENSAPSEVEEEDENREVATGIILSELLPNPVGSDDTEFVELYNTTDEQIDLSNWFLSDLSTTKKIGDCNFEQSTFLLSGGDYFVVERSQGSVRLNNSGDEISLLNPVGEMVDSVVYEALGEGVAYAREGSYWRLTATPTKGYENQFTEKDNASPDHHTSSCVSIKEAKGCVLKETVQVIGWASVEKDLLGSNIFYVQDETGGIRVSVSSASDDHVPLSSKLQVTGQLCHSRGEYYLKAEEVEVYEGEEEVPPRSVSSGEVGESVEGVLVLISGEVIERSGATFWVDDGSGRAKVSPGSHSGVATTDAKLGSLVTVVGIVSQWGKNSDGSDNYRLLLRYQNDIERALPLAGSDSVLNGASAPSVLPVLGTTKKPGRVKKTQLRKGKIPLLSRVFGSGIVEKSTSEEVLLQEEIPSGRLARLSRWGVLLGGFSSLLYFKIKGYY